MIFAFSLTVRAAEDMVFTGIQNRGCTYEVKAEKSDSVSAMPSERSGIL